MNATGPVIVPEQPPLRWEDGVFRIASSRVTLDSIVWAFNNGDSPEEIARNFDALSLSEVYRAIGYYLEHRSEIDAYIARGDQEHEQMRREVEARHDSAGIRERLLSRARQKH